MTFDDKGQHKIYDDGVKIPFWLWPKIAQKSQNQGVNKYRLKKKVTEKLFYQISPEGPFF